MSWLLANRFTFVTSYSVSVLERVIDKLAVIYPNLRHRDFCKDVGPGQRLLTVAPTASHDPDTIRTDCDAIAEQLLRRGSECGNITYVNNVR